MTRNEQRGAGSGSTESGSAIVEVISSRGGAWRRLVLGGGRGNLLSLDLVRACGEMLHQLESEPGIKWLTIEGAGGEFSYGARVHEHTPERMPTVLPEAQRLIKRLLAFPAPTAALVEGRCLGGGFELALSCDDILATDSAEFGFPEIRLAGFPPAGAALLPLRVGASRATRAIVTGQIQNARYWHDAGLLSMVAPQSSLIEAAAQWFDTQLAPHSAVGLAHATAAARLTLRAQAEPALDRAERDYLSGVLKTRDAVEGVTAFLEKRPPRWEHK
ncbi:MAG TPA: enoyl-CoA hydratase/isomerase family protein [Vicinamibacterales bacterium]|nr:enoyl-CoA hydratase/isomerase family protein [Vicinamibacterales bacterium]